MFLILSRNLLAAAPAKKVKFEEIGSEEVFSLNNNDSCKKLRQHK